MDLTDRARKTLSDVALIAAEDTRRTGTLLKACEITTPVIAYHDHNEREAAKSIIENIEQGKSVALVSDAGTPMISDPGFHLVEACLSAGITVVPVPGPSSVTAALSVSGIPGTRFTFEGFLPSKAKARKALLESLGNEPRTMVFFEAPHRVTASLEDMVEVFGSNRTVTLCRELTKTFEQIVKGELGAVTQQVKEGAIANKGEFVLVVTGSSEASHVDARGLVTELVKDLPPNRVAAITAKLTNMSRSEAYELALEIRGQFT